MTGAGPDALAPGVVRLALGVVLDVALHARPRPVSARAVSDRNGLPPRSLEPVLQRLVRRGILRSVRGPLGGYELARERRRISAGDVARAALPPAERDASSRSPAMDAVIGPLVEAAADAFLDALDATSIEDLCREAERAGGAAPAAGLGDFAI